MPVEWSGLAPEILLELDRTRRGTLGAQLREHLREAIRSGRLAADERLPSSRAMAAELALSRGLVQDSYEQLAAEGYLVARSGAATRVAAGAQTATAAAPPVVPSTRLSVDFAPGIPDLSSFPVADWLWAFGEAVRRAPVTAAGYDETRGRRELREVVAAYLRRVRGAAADPEQIVICSGFTQGLHLVLEALARRGHAALGVEEPGHQNWTAIAHATGLAPVPLQVDEQGADVRSLEGTGARAVLLTPAHQTPTGVVLSGARRHALVAWAAAHDGVLIEDDYDAEFRYDREPVGCLQGLAPVRTVTIGSVSKSLAPAIRLGWVVCPPSLVGAVAEAKQRADRGSAGFDQLALARLMASGRYDRHLRRMRGRYAERRAALVEALATHAPGARLTGLTAGFHAVLQLPPHLDEIAVATAARARSIGVQPMREYRLTPGQHPPQLVLGFGNLTVPAIHRGIAVIGDLLD